MPAVVEADLTRFGEALEEIQRRVGEGFAPAQGGTFARPEFEVIVEAMRLEGLKGVGQSSWGPTLYGFSDSPKEERISLLDRLNRRLGLDPSSSFWTLASSSGASIATETSD
jgi:beta-ribofuranosylaminobenzene 5'-phosphate synthase